MEMGDGGWGMGDGARLSPNGVNAVFNHALRERQATYAGEVFAALGHDFTLVRLGWGWYSALNFGRR